VGKYYYPIIIYWENHPTIKTSFGSHHSWYQRSVSAHRQKHMWFDNSYEISTSLNMVLSLALTLSEIQLETPLQILIFVHCIFRYSHEKQILYNLMHFKKPLSLEVISRDSCIKPVSMVIESFPWSHLMITPFISITLHDNYFS